MVKGSEKVRGQKVTETSHTEGTNRAQGTWEMGDSHSGDV